MVAVKSPRFTRRFFILSGFTLVLFGLFYHFYYGSAFEVNLGTKSKDDASGIRHNFVILRNSILRKKTETNSRETITATNTEVEGLISNEKSIDEDNAERTDIKLNEVEEVLQEKVYTSSPTPSSFTETTTTVSSATQPTTESDFLTVTYKPNLYGDFSSCPNTYRHYLQDLFKHWVKLAKEHKIEYVIFYGTLLGALRNGDVIPWDSDMDLLLDVKYWPKIKSLASERNFSTSDWKIRLVVQPEFMKPGPSTGRRRFTCKGNLTPHMVDQCSFQEPLARLIKGGFHIDFYHFYDRGTRLQDDSEEFTRFYNKRDFFPLKKCYFMDIETLCPRNPWPPLQVYFRSKEIAESPYLCSNGKWKKKHP